MPPPLDLVELMASKVVQLGYVMLFAAACPLAPLVAFLLNTVQVRAIIQVSTTTFHRECLNTGMCCAVHKFVPAAAASF